MLLIPAHAIAETSDVCDVVGTVPRVQREIFFESHQPDDRMSELPLELAFGKRTKLANLIPARRALRIHPQIALRSE